MLRRRGDPLDDHVDFHSEAGGQLRNFGRCTNPALRAIQPVQRDQRQPAARSAPLSKLGLKLVPGNAVFSVLIETGDPPVELGSLGIGDGYVLVLEALPKGLDQLEPLTW